MEKRLAKKLLSKDNKGEERFIIRYMYDKWLQAESSDEKVMILYDLLTNVTGVHSKKERVPFGIKFVNYFRVSLDELELMDVYDMYDFIEERGEELDDMWYTLVTMY